MAIAFYNPRVFRPFTSRGFHWHLAAWLSCLAVLSALLAPVSLLAQDVRSGQLGGLCRAQAAAPNALTAPSSDWPDGPAAPGDSHVQHCELCFTPGLAGLALASLGQPLVAMASSLPVTATPGRPTRRLGLPASRGPPARTPG